MTTDIDPRTRPRERRKASLRLGRVAGIDIRVHATFALLVVLVAVGASAPGPPSVAAQLLWLVILFGGIVVHELAHSVVAQRYGVTVTEIDLLPIGGLSKMTAEPREPRQQLFVAAAGPLTSIGLGVTFALLASVGGHDLWPPALVDGSLLVRTAWINLILGVFNLLPAFPMDGGRVLRAVLAERMAAERATAIAARLGRWLAVAMIVLGLYANLWLLLIGVFIYVGSWSEQLGAATRAALSELRVRDVMVAPHPAVLAQASAHAEPADAFLVDTDLLDAEFDTRPVVRDGQVVGMIRADDLDTAILRLVHQKVR